MSVSGIPRVPFSICSRICRPCLKRGLQTRARLQARGDGAITKASPRRAAMKGPGNKGATKYEMSFKPYTEKELAELRSAYTPAQMAAIEAGEEAIDLNDLADQATFRTDSYALDQDDDLSRINPTVDFAKPAPEENYDPDSRFKTTEEMQADFADFVGSLPENPTGTEYDDFIRNYLYMTGKPEAQTNPISYLAPPIPKGLSELKGGRKELKKTADLRERPEDTRHLMLQTGLTFQELKKLQTKVLIRHRVVNQTRLGKISSYYALALCGNGRGMIGIGEGKSMDTVAAAEQARARATRNMQPVSRYEDRTIFGQVKGKVGAVELELIHRPPGYGLRCQHLIYEVCKIAGLTDISARSTRARNPMNTVKATVQALMSQRTPDEMARGLGRKLVDVRKVYYGR